MPVLALAMDQEAFLLCTSASASLCQKKNKSVDSSPTPPVSHVPLAPTVDTPMQIASHLSLALSLKVYQHSRQTLFFFCSVFGVLATGNGTYPAMVRRRSHPGLSTWTPIALNRQRSYSYHFVRAAMTSTTYFLYEYYVGAQNTVPGHRPGGHGRATIVPVLVIPGRIAGSYKHRRRTPCPVRMPSSFLVLQPRVHQDGLAGHAIRPFAAVRVHSRLGPLRLSCSRSHPPAFALPDLAACPCPPCPWLGSLVCPSRHPLSPTNQPPRTRRTHITHALDQRQGGLRVVVVPYG